MPDDPNAPETGSPEAQSLAVASARTEIADIVFIVLAEQARDGVDLPEGFATRVSDTVARRSTHTLEWLASRRSR